MKIYGIDFTSSPSRRKPLTVAIGSLGNGLLRIKHFRRLESYGPFENLLREPGPWVAGIDFPFGQSRRLLENLGWPTDWADYVSRVDGMSREEFRTVLEAYKAPRDDGDKEHRRKVDELAGSISPQKLHGVPVGLMFYEGARRLLRTPASILPQRPRPGDRVIVEAYPALVARRWIGRIPYKNDDPRKQTVEQRTARETILGKLVDGECRQAYGIRVAMSQEDAQRLAADPAADLLDALLCAVQAAWAYGQRTHGYGMPRDVDQAEGWIADPQVMTG